MHIHALNRGVLLTPFHNMALMSPATTEADVEIHTRGLSGGGERAPWLSTVQPTTEPEATQRPADIRLENITKEFDDVVAVDGISLDDRARPVLRAPRPVGLRQDDDAPHDRRLRGADLGLDLARRPRRRRPAAVQAERQHRLPELRPLPAPRRSSRTSRSGCGRAGRAQGEQRPGASRDPRARRPRRAARRASRGSSPAASSSGSRSRARSSTGPHVLLLDEPLGALDLKLRKQMQLELKAIQHDVGITFVHVTHDQEEAMTMADTIAVMNSGRIEQLGDADRALRAAADGVRRRLPRRLEPALGNRRRRRARSRSTAARPSPSPPSALDGRTGRVAVGVRPEKIRARHRSAERAPREGRRGARTSASRPSTSSTTRGASSSVYVQNTEAGAASGRLRATPCHSAFDPEADFVVDPAARRRVA